MKLITAVVLLSATAMAIAAPARSKHLVSTSRLRLDQPCDLHEGMNVGPKFKGHSGADLASLLQAKKLTKDEYESNAQFQARAESVIRMLPSAIALGKLCGIQLRSIEPTRYDAEAKTLWARVAPSDRWFDSSWLDGKDLRWAQKISLQETHVRRSHYDAANAFGAGANVERIKQSAFYLAFDAPQFREGAKLAGAKANGMYLEFPLPMPGQQAKAIGDHAAIVWLYKLATPYVRADHLWEAPTIDSPYELDEDQRWILATITGVAIINQATGDILKVWAIDQSATADSEPR